MDATQAPALRAVCVVTLCLAVGLGACKSSSGSGGGGGTTTGAGTVVGVVFDIGTGSRLSGVTVAGGGQTASTGSDGQFTFTNLAGSSVPLTFSLANYAPGYANAQPGGTAGDSLVVTLKKRGTLQAYDPTTTSTLTETTESGPYAVTLTAGSLATTDHNLQVSVTPLDPTKEAAALPGQLVTAGSSAALLSPVTFAEFTILDSAGNRVQLTATASATVELPIPPSLRSTYPLTSTIHCYAYDPTAGSWNDFVDGTVATSSVDGSTPVLRAAIRHFSWYGGAPQASNCQAVVVKVVSAVSGSPLGNAHLEATPGTGTYTDANGFATVWVEQGAQVNYFATQTGFDVDGSLTGIKGAKYIEYGKVTETLPMPRTFPCNNLPAPTGNSGTDLGETGNPLEIKIGAIAKLTYQATALLLAGTGGTGGEVEVILQSGIPDANGQLQSPQPASGAVIALSGNGASTTLKEVSAGTGLYLPDPAAAPFPVAAGQLYTISIDADGNGSIDGSGSVFAVGQIAWTNPTDGMTLAASGLVATWSDSAAGTTGYAPLYFASLDGSADGAAYVGTALQFEPQSATSSTPAPLTPGSYTGTLEAFSGISNNLSLGSGYSLANNITGPAVSGTFFSYGNAQTITFTLQ
ncbi:MAG TPA: hypothetical protein VMK42_13960 [Anaeromyxobacteraceae bacterium]|nr:hypothetical protein [Anaeromyxobacteraceae bacterium]